MTHCPVDLARPHQSLRTMSRPFSSLRSTRWPEYNNENMETKQNAIESLPSRHSTATAAYLQTDKQTDVNLHAVCWLLTFSSWVEAWLWRSHLHQFQEGGRVYWPQPWPSVQWPELHPSCGSCCQSWYCLCLHRSHPDSTEGERGLGSGSDGRRNANLLGQVFGLWEDLWRE